MFKNIYSYFILSFCSITTYAQTLKDVPAVTVISSSMVQPKTLRDSVTIFYFDKFTIYKISKPQFSSTVSISEDNNFSQSQFVQQKTYYFGFRNKDNKGYRINQDSIVEIIRDPNNFMEDVFVRWSFDFATSLEGGHIKKIDSSNLFNHIEMFVFNPKPSSSLPDSVILYYGKKFKEIKFRFTDVYDLWQDYKLEKILLIYHISTMLTATRASGHEVIEYFSELCSPTQNDYEIASTLYRLLLNKLY